QGARGGVAAGRGRPRGGGPPAGGRPADATTGRRPRGLLPTERPMTDERAPSKAELLAALRSSRDDVVRMVRGLAPERLEEGRYENGWNGRQILAHLASIEWSYPRLIDIARDAAAAPVA